VVFTWYVHEFDRSRHYEHTTVPLTKYGAELLKEELHQLKTKERRSVIDAIAEARSHGDLSENAEYDAAKERQAFVEGRIAELEGKLSTPRRSSTRPRWTPKAAWCSPRPSTWKTWNRARR
jgi:hypothetical protein